MTDLFTVISDKGTQTAAAVEIWQDGVILAATETANFLPGSPLISQSAFADKSIHTFIKYAALDGGGALTDGVEVTSDEMVDSEVNLTLAEYGNVVTTTNLGHVSTGGRLDPAAAELVGRDMATTLDKVAIQVLEAATNEVTVNATNEATTAATDIITPAFVQKMYNKLRRSNIPGPYFAVGHPDVMYDLKAGTAANNWTEVLKYTNAGGVFANQIQSYGGFGWIESSNITINTDAGASAVDTYHTIFMGYNALGLAVSSSVPLTTTLISGTDKLDRFLHIGWKAILAYGIIDTNAVWLLTSASTVGAN